jgi:hypothetical protein
VCELQVKSQSDVGEEAYDMGAKMRYTFFKQQLTKLDEPGLDPWDKHTIEACLNRASSDACSELITNQQAGALA